MKIAISSPAVCSLSGLLYVIGGSFFDHEDVIDLVQVYNPSLDTWKEIDLIDLRYKMRNIFEMYKNNPSQYIEMQKF